MKVSYQYASPSMCLRQNGQTTLGLCPDSAREEQVSFRGRIKRPLAFRDAMLMLRQIVISDASQKMKERTEFFAWLDAEIERRVREHGKYLPGIREGLHLEMDGLSRELNGKESEISKLLSVKKDLQKEIDRHDAWHDYYLLEKKFWQFIRSRDLDLWIVLDPVITVHPDEVSFEAFSIDESIYGCMSVKMDEFEILGTPKLGTTNIDFSMKLAKEIERFRTYSQVELSVNPEGFAVDRGAPDGYMEKKIDLPESWIKGFNQVSSASNLSGLSVELAPVDMYDICSFLRRHKTKKSPRYMKWVLEKNKPIHIVFEPYGTALELKTIYSGSAKREEKIWGRERWLVAEKLIPLAKSFTIKLLGFGMPQFIVADLGNIKMTIGFTSWSANDWVKGTAFNIMSGFVGDGAYDDVYALMKHSRRMSVNALYDALQSKPKREIVAGIGALLKRGEGYFDAAENVVRFRKLCNSPIPEDLYGTTETELAVEALMGAGMNNWTMSYSDKGEYIFNNKFQIPNAKYRNASYRGTADFNIPHYETETTLVIDTDGQISDVKCGCRAFNKGPRNISAPCPHILALYMLSTKFTKLTPRPGRTYKVSDIIDDLL